MGFSLSKCGAPREPGKGIVLEELLPEGVDGSMVELSGSFVMFKIFLWATEFEFILSDILTDVLGFTGRSWGNISILNENLCVTVLTGGLGFCLAGGGNPDDYPAFLEFTVSLTFLGAMVNGSELALKVLLSARLFWVVLKFELAFK